MSNQAGVNVTLEQTEDALIRRDSQDVSGFLDDNKAERNSGENDQRGKNARKFASIPVVVLQQLKDQLGIDWNLVGKCPEHTGRFFLWLRENPYFRTSTSEVGDGSRYVQ